MTLVNIKVIVTASLVAQYGNFKTIQTSMGEAKVPAVYRKAILNVPPAIITIPGVSYEFFIDNCGYILESIPYHEDFIKLKQRLNSIDTHKIKIPETIPVTEVPIRYVTVDGSGVKHRTVTKDGITSYGDEDLFKALLDDDDDDSSDTNMYIENISQYVSPEFIFQKTMWTTYSDILEYSIVQDKPVMRDIPDNVRATASPIKSVINRLFGKD